MLSEVSDYGLGCVQKQTVDSTTTPVKTTATKYLGAFVYQNDTLQFIGDEEGRIRAKRVNYSDTMLYDYFLKDHLGNVRMVLTQQKDTAQYMATMESAYRNTETQLFYNLHESNYGTAAVGGYPSDPTTNPNDSLMKLNGSGQKVGAAIVLKVMSGDMLDIAVKAFYKDQTYSNPNNPINDVLNSFATGVVTVTGGSKGTLSDFNNTSTSPLYGALQSFMTANNGTITNKPRAYLNWILLDEQFKYVSSYPQSGAIAIGNYASNTLNTLGYTGVNVTKSGYLFIYVSNETPGWDVFFDNLSIKHYPGPMLEETHYYPFGGTMAGISSKSLNFGGSENKQRFNGYEQQNKEFSDGSGLDWYDYKHRFYDNQIGRFFCIDRIADQYPYYTPYAFAGNRVTIAVDLDGDEPKYMIDGNGQLTNPMKSLLHAAFGYSMSSMDKTTWQASNFSFGAITVYRTVKYDKSLSSAGDADWANLIAHEQKHRDEIGNDLVGAMNWYVNYGVGYVGAGFNYEGNPAEARAYATGGPMDKLMNFGGGVALKVLQGNYDDNAKSETLNFIGLAFNLSEQTTTLNSMQDKLDNFTGSDKAKHRLERRIERQQKRVDAASQQVQEAATDNVVNTLDDVNKPKN